MKMVLCLCTTVVLSPAPAVKLKLVAFLSTVCFDVSRSIRSQAVESVECHYLLPGISVMTCQAWNKEQASEKPLNGPGRGCD